MGLVFSRMEAKRISGKSESMGHLKLEVFQAVFTPRVEAVLTKSSLLPTTQSSTQSSAGDYFP